MRQRLERGEPVAHMYQETGLAWLERQAEVAEDLVTQRQQMARQLAGIATQRRCGQPHVGTDAHHIIKAEPLGVRDVGCARPGQR
jgi:hypothetical protein